MLALVTGASSRISKALAYEHAKHNGDLILVARLEAKRHELKRTIEDKHHVKVEVIAKELSLPTAPQEIFDGVQSNNLMVEDLGYRPHSCNLTP